MIVDLVIHVSRVINRQTISVFPRRQGTLLNEPRHSRGPLTTVVYIPFWNFTLSNFRCLSILPLPSMQIKRVKHYL